MKKASLPGDIGMINVKLSERWRGETTVMGQVQRKEYDRDRGGWERERESKRALESEENVQRERAVKA